MDAADALIAPVHREDFERSFWERHPLFVDRQGEVPALYGALAWEEMVLGLTCSEQPGAGASALRGMGRRA